MTLRAIKFYHDPTSEPSRAVHWFILEANIEVETAFVWLTRNEHREPHFLKVNPRHQVPALEHGPVRLSEAVAIITYLAETVGQEVRWFGDSAAARARTAMLLSWYHTNLRLRLTLEYFLPVLLRPAYDGAPLPAPERVDALQTAVRDAFGHIENWLSESPYLGGVRPNAADVIFAADCTTLWSDPQTAWHLEGFPRLAAWLARWETRPAFVHSHAPWRALAGRMQSDLRTGVDIPRDRIWVADYVEQRLEVFG